MSTLPPNRVATITLTAERKLLDDGQPDRAGPLFLTAWIPGKGSACVILTPEPGYVVALDFYGIERAASLAGQAVSFEPAPPAPPAAPDAGADFEEA